MNKYWFQVVENNKENIDKMEALFAFFLNKQKISINTSSFLLEKEFISFLKEYDSKIKVKHCWYSFYDNKVDLVFEINKQFKFSYVYHALNKTLKIEKINYKHNDDLEVVFKPSQIDFFIQDITNAKVSYFSFIINNDITMIKSDYNPENNQLLEKYGIDKALKKLTENQRELILEAIFNGYLFDQYQIDMLELEKDLTFKKDAFSKLKLPLKRIKIV